MQRRFIQCDVFTATPTLGNGLAVVLDGEGLSDVQMQRFAAWTNLAETTFLRPSQNPAADYELKIFTPKREMLFAGHPTLGSAAAWTHAGGRPQRPGRIVQDCGVGLVEIDLAGAPPAFAAPATTVAPIEPQEAARILAALQIAPERVVSSARLANGPVWQVFELESAAGVLAVDAGRVRYPEFLGIGLIGPQDPGGATDYEVRMLGASSGMSEDPITGSLNAAIAQWMAATGRWSGVTRVAQGTAMGRAGRVHVRIEPRTEGAAPAVWIGGETHILIEGTLDL